MRVVEGKTDGAFSDLLAESKMKSQETRLLQTERQHMIGGTCTGLPSYMTAGS